MTSEDPVLKGLVNDIINKFLHYFSPDSLKDFIFGLISNNYQKGLDEKEVELNMNFMPDYATVSFIQRFAFDNVKGLADETKDKLRKEMSIGLMNGESVSQLKLRIMDVMDASIQRAEMIARTESVRAFNMGHYQAAKDSGLELIKEWSTHEDERTCATCGYLDRQRVGLSERFKTLDGEEFLLSPAHPNCRCRVIYVQPHNVVKV